MRPSLCCPKFFCEGIQHLWLVWRHLLPSDLTHLSSTNALGEFGNAKHRSTAASPFGCSHADLHLLHGDLGSRNWDSTFSLSTKNIFQSASDIAQVKKSQSFLSPRLSYWSCAQRWHSPQGVDYGLKEASGGLVDGLDSDSKLQIAARLRQSPSICSHCQATPLASSPPSSNGFCGFKDWPHWSLELVSIQRICSSFDKFDFVQLCLSTHRETCWDGMMINGKRQGRW